MKYQVKFSVNLVSFVSGHPKGEKLMLVFYTMVNKTNYAFAQFTQTGQLKS